MDNFTKKDNLNSYFFDTNNCYYIDNYVKLYLKENEEVFKFFYSENNNIFYNISIKSKIKDTNYYDLKTAYGYGGYFINTDDKEFIYRALNKYSKKCIEENIIAEFIRFDIFNKYIPNLKGFLDFFSYNRDTIFIDLLESNENRINKYSSRIKSYIKKSNNVFYIKKLNSLDEINYFIELYYNSMIKNSADNFYFFDKNYFIKIFKENFSEFFGLFKDNELVTTISLLISDKIVNYHLSGNTYKYKEYSPIFFFFNKLFEYYKSKGKECFLLGGGRTSNKNDSLLLFKSKFSNNKLPYYIGGKIFIKEKYEELCKNAEKDNNNFLKYR